MNDVATRLRKLSLDAETQALLGSEEDLVAKLGAARATVRQAARIVEREGLLLVRRGMNGGYFAARPGLDTIEATTSTYLESLDMDAEDVTYIASLLWVDVVRKACGLGTDRAREVARAFQKRIAHVRPRTPFSEIIALEQDLRTAIFDITKARYIELIFNINAAFARRHFVIEDLLANRPTDTDFTRSWRRAKLLEMQAIIDGDAAVGVMAARYSRRIWHNRLLPADKPALPVWREEQAETYEDE